MQVGRTSSVYHSMHKCCFSICNLCILAYSEKTERKGENWDKCTSTLMLHSSILRMRRKSKKEGVHREKDIVQGVCSQNIGNKLSGR